MDPDTQQPVHPALRRQSVMSKNSTIHQIFRALFKKNMAQTEYNEIARNYNDERTHQEILLDELKKRNPKKHNTTGWMSDIIKEMNKNKANEKKKDKGDKRSKEKILFVLKQLPGFPKFMAFNCIDDEHIKAASKYMEHLFVPKGNYVFRQGDNNKIFYGIIRGKISIRIRKFSPSIVAIPEKEHESDNDFSDSSKIPYFAKRKSAIKYVKDIENEKVFSEYDLEEEKTVLGPGMCFGEWAMIYNSPTSASTFALEDTDLFCIDKEHFDSTLSRPIMKADVDKKNFIIRKIPSFKKEGNILHVLRMITSQFYDIGDIIYTQFDKAEYLFVVYQGECCIKYNSLIKSREELTKNKDKLITLTKIDRGGMAGLDIATDRSTYKYNLIANRDFTVVYKISLRSLKESNPDIIKYLLPIYLNQTERMRLFLDKKKEIEMSDLFYHPKYKSKKKALTDHNETFKYAESVIEKIKNAVKPSYNEVKQEIKVLPKKEPGFYNKIKKFLMTKKRKLGTLHALEIFQNKTSLDKLKDYFTNDKSPEKTKNFTLNRLQKKNTLYLTQQNFMDLNLPLDFNTSSRGSKLSSKNLISFDNRKLSTGLQKKKLSKEVSFNEENSIKEFTLDSTLKSKNSTYQSRLSLKRSEILIEGDSNYDDRRNSTVDHLKEEKQFSDRLKINLKYKIDKPIRDTLNMWKKKNKSNIAYYDSGNFSMPLVTESFMNNTGQ